jgi:hypothetical protein
MDSSVWHPVRLVRRRLLAAVAATGAVALAAPLVAASAATGAAPLAATGAQIQPFSSWFPPTGSLGAGGAALGSSGCVGSYRPSLGGENGSASSQTCDALLAFTGPAIGQISSVIGPTMIGSPGSVVILSAGPVTTVP